MSASKKISLKKEGTLHKCYNILKLKLVLPNNTEANYFVYISDVASMLRGNKHIISVFSLKKRGEISDKILT